MNNQSMIPNMKMNNRMGPLPFTSFTEFLLKKHNTFLIASLLLVVMYKDYILGKTNSLEVSMNNSKICKTFEISNEQKPIAVFLPKNYSFHMTVKQLFPGKYYNQLEMLSYFLGEEGVNRYVKVLKALYKQMITSRANYSANMNPLTDEKLDSIVRRKLDLRPGNSLELAIQKANMSVNMKMTQNKPKIASAFFTQNGVSLSLEERIRHIETALKEHIVPKGELWTMASLPKDLQTMEAGATIRLQKEKVKEMMMNQTVEKEKVVAVMSKGGQKYVSEVMTVRGANNKEDEIFVTKIGESCYVYLLECPIGSMFHFPAATAPAPVKKMNAVVNATAPVPMNMTMGGDRRKKQQRKQKKSKTSKK